VRRILTIRACSMHLVKDVFIASFGDRAIALDLNNGRYLALGRSLTAALSRVMDGEMSAAGGPSDRSLSPEIAILAARGLVCDRGVLEPARAIVMPCSTLWPALGSEDDAAVGLAQVLGALAEAQLLLAALPLRRIVRRLRRAKARVAALASRPPVLAYVAQFTRSRPWYPAKPVCRLDAIALCLFLWRNGLPAELVFGVRLDPFRAHCWAQYKGLALNDAHDFVAQFTPIMAV
jgi:hypothetical protein